MNTISVGSINKRHLKNDLYTIIRNDIPLRNKIASSLNIEPASVYVLARRKSKKFSLPFIVELISEHTGKSKEEILEP